MKNWKGIEKISRITLVLLLAASVMLIAVPINAQVQETQGGEPLPAGVTPDYTFKTKAYMSFRPNPVGKDQIFLVNLWSTPACHRSRYHTSYVVQIQKPDGSTVSVGPIDSYPADTTAWFEWIADQVGVWRFKFEFGGSYFPPADVPGGFMEADVVTLSSVYYEPSSTDWQELVVQEDMVYSWPPAEIPTDYWTWPISPENREWFSIAGQYPWRGPGGGSDWPANTNPYWSDSYSFVPWVQAPNSAHIVWKQQTSIGGLVGRITGEQTLVETLGASGFGSAPSVILHGRCYQSVTLTGGETALRCFDLRTGETIWEISPDPTPTSFGIFGPSAGTWQIEYTGGSTEVPGAQAQFGIGVSLVTISDGRLLKLDPWSGVVTTNASIAPLTDGTYYKNGYAISVQSTNPMWPFAGPEPEYRLINWTTLAPSAGFMAAAVYNFAESVMSNVSWPLGDAQYGAIYDFEAGIGAVVAPITPAGSGIWAGTRIQVADMKTGNLLWDKTVEETNYSPMCALADHGKVAFLTMDGYWMAFNVYDGSLAWRSEVMDYPWDAPGFGAYASASAYGLFYRNAYSGVYAFDWDDGSIAWKFEAKTPHQFETPYVTTDGEGVYSFNGGGLIVDGKYYVYNTEHTPTSPLTRGWKLYCLDATSGEHLWDITGSIPVGSTFGGSGAAAVADGYLIGTSSYDGYMYCFGKGKSQTTVTAPDDAVPKGTAITIKGNVLDMSPAQPNTPCVSADSMTTQMQYLHMQHPIDGVAHNEMITGVPVILTAYDASGNFIDIGTVISEGYYGSYGMSWTPEEEGTYKITANFAGDDSYGSSGASTYVTVGPAAGAGGIIEPEHPLISTEVALVIAVIAVVVIGAVAYVFLKKRK